MHAARLAMYALSVGILAGCATAMDSPSALRHKTVLFYDVNHGNQIEYFDSGGSCYLWYPGNKRVVPGKWKESGKNICFIYGENTYNPVTGSPGDRWQCMSFARWKESIDDSDEGDIFTLSNMALPFSLPVYPRFRALTDVKPASSPVQPNKSLEPTR